MNNLKFSLSSALICLLCLTSSSTFSQLSYNYTNNMTDVCENDGSAQVYIHVINGTAPYTLTYNDGSTNQTVTSSSFFFLVQIPSMGTGIFTQNLLSISDANNESVAINQQFFINRHPTPIIQVSVTQTACNVTVCSSGASSYTVSPFIDLCVPTIPTTIGTTVYTIIGVNNIGCAGTTQTTVTVNSIPPSASNTPVAAIDSAYCTDGIISLSLLTPAPFSVTWNGNLGTSPFLTGLSSGNYTAIVTDTAGCIFSVNYNVPLSQLPSTCGIIRGNVNYDMDESCSITTGDIPSCYKIITANPGNYTTISDGNGNYEFRLNPGTYTLTETINNPSIAPICNATQTVNLSTGQVIENVDFSDTTNGEIDLTVLNYHGVVRPGFSFYYIPSVKNILPPFIVGAENAWFIIPVNVDLVNWNYPHTISNDTVYFTANSANNSLPSVILMATNVQLGDVVTFCAGVNINAQENITANNSMCTSTIAIGSYDPNDKTTFVDGIPSNGPILLSDEILEYVIRFQNTGTADAINVSVLDTIQQYLNISTFELLETSHICDLKLLPDNVLKFDFNNIQLPDSTSDEAGSHGFIRYRIRQNSANIVGDLIENTAYIYFDFNEAVITNTTQNIIYELWGIEEVKAGETVHIFPNPTENNIKITGNSTLKSAVLYTVNGQELMQVNGQENQLEIDLSLFKAGIYLLRIETENGIITKKIQKK